MFQEVIMVKVYKLSDADTDFEKADSTYIGCIKIMWKETVRSEKDGESQLLQFKEELRDPTGDVKCDLSGMISGEL